MGRSRLLRAGLLLCCWLLSFAAWTQSLTVISSGTDAKACSYAAKLPGNNRPSAREDLASCSRALDFAQLSRADRAATLVNRGILLAAAGRFMEALDDYNQALQLIPELPEAYVGRGNLVFLAGRYDMAVREYNRALELGISRPHLALYNRGLAFEKNGDSAAARKDYLDALVLSPEWLLPKERLNRLAAAGQP